MEDIPDVRHIDMLKEGTLLRPPPDCCQECGAIHEPHLPHNQQSLYYQMAFFKIHDRWPTWTDAMEHCTPEIRAAWKEIMARVIAEREAKGSS